MKWEEYPEQLYITNFITMEKLAKEINWTEYKVGDKVKVRDPWLIVNRGTSATDFLIDYANSIHNVKYHNTGCIVGALSGLYLTPIKPNNIYTINSILDFGGVYYTLEEIPYSWAHPWLIFADEKSERIITNLKELNTRLGTTICAKCQGKLKNCMGVDPRFNYCPKCEP